MIRSLIRRKPASRWAKTAVTIGGSLVALGSVNAQTPAAATGETAEPERIIITGSNIPTAAEVGAAPVATLDAAAIGRAGTDDPQVTLQKSDPSFTGGGNLGASNASVSSGNTQGGSQISIRGLPTLVLLNGRRIADSAALAQGGAQFQYVNLFPTALIKRIEVLKDGASAIYGADAVGGVVNVLLNDDFQGVAISGRFGFAEKGDIQDQRYSGVAGFGDDKTRFVVAAQYQEQDPIFTLQREFAKSRSTNLIGITGTSSNFGGRISINSASTYLNTGLGNPIVPGSIAPGLNSPNDQPTVNTASIAPIFDAAGNQIFAVSQFPAGTYGTSRSLNLNQFTTITLDQNRTNAYGSFERVVVDKYLTVFGDFLYSKNYSQSQLAPQPIATNSSPNAEQNMIIANGAPFNPFNTTIGQPQGAVGRAPAFNADGTPFVNAAGTQLTGGNLVVTNRLLNEPRVFRNDTQFYRILAGLKGEIIKDYNYEVAYTHSEDTIDFKTFNLVRSDTLNEAIAGGFNADGSAAPAQFATVTTPGGFTYQQVTQAAGAFSRVNGQIVPALDPFALNNPAVTGRSVLGTVVQNQQTKLTTIDGRITGFPVTLPAGPLGFAIGGEYRHESLRLNSSVQNFVASVPASDVQAGRDIEAGFIEVSIPIVGPNMKIPGVYSFDISGAARYENYEGTGDNVVPKVSVVYRPVDSVAVRGSYSKAFQAPNLILTQGPPTAGFTALTNLGAPFSEQANAINTSNPALGPVRSDTYSAGIVLSPKQVPGLTVSGDFFHVEQKGIITAGASSTTVLNSVNALGSASPFNSLVHFGSPTGPNLTTPVAGQLAGNASNYFIVTTLNNNTVLRESGVDFTFNYDHDFGQFGGVTLGLNGTYYFQYKINDTRGAPLYDVVGLYLGGIGGQYVPEYKLVPYVSYRFQGFQASALMQYLPSMRDGGFLNNGLDRRDNYTTYAGTRFNLPQIRDYYTIDATFSYEFGLNKPMVDAPVPAPKEGKDGKDGKDSKSYKATSQEMAKQMMGFKLLDGLKLTVGINNVTNARPPFINISPDSNGVDAAVYDPFQRYFYFVVSKKF